MKIYGCHLRGSLFFADYLGSINDICNTIKKLCKLQRDTPFKWSPRQCVYVAPVFPEVTQYALSLKSYVYIQIVYIFNLPWNNGYILDAVKFNYSSTL